MIETPHLLPCPFCGEEPVSFPSGDGTGVMIQCMTPDCVQPHVSYYGEGVAVAIWNRRADLSEQNPPDPHGEKP